MLACATVSTAGPRVADAPRPRTAGAITRASAAEDAALIAARRYRRRQMATADAGTPAAASSGVNAWATAMLGESVRRTACVTATAPAAPPTIQARRSAARSALTALSYHHRCGR